MAIHTLNITKSGTGTGTVTSDVGTPAVSCGATCTVFQVGGATVTLTATADPGSSFVGWTGDLVSSLTTDSYVQAAGNANINAEFTLSGSLTLTPEDFPNGINGSTYSVYVYATGGTAPYTYSISSGSLPTGLTLNTTTGLISGTPTVNGLYSFTITALDPYSVTGSLATSISVNTTNISLADNYNRLQHFMCCLGSKGSTLATKLRYSTDCCCDINTLNLLVMYWRVLVCYNPTATGNCLTQTQINTIWDDIACKCGICFAPYGSIYNLPRGGAGCTNSGQRLLEDGNQRIAENGGDRISECGTTSPTTPTGVGVMIVGSTNIVG